MKYLEQVCLSHVNPLNLSSHRASMWSVLKTSTWPGVVVHTLSQQFNRLRSEDRLSHELCQLGLHSEILALGRWGGGEGGPQNSVEHL